VRDEITTLLGWQQDGGPFALATVIDTSRSAPRPAGAAIAVHPDGRIAGNVSGGCVEPAVVALCEEVLAEGGTRRMRFGYSDDEAFAVGLTCGGEVEVLVRRVEAGTLAIGPLAAALAADRPVTLLTIVDSASDPSLAGMSLVVTGDAAHGDLASTDLGRVLTLEARAGLGVGGVSIRRLGAHGERLEDAVTVLFESFVDRPRLLVLGAIDYAAAMASVGRFLGYHVTVCDARAAFATDDRFPDAHEVVVDWPHRYLAGTELDARSAICVLTHDPKFDVPAVLEALRGPAGYIGVMGSRRTHEDRLDRLRAAGATEHELARLHSPIGLALGGRSPQETAIAIAAELVMVRNGATGLPLRTTSGPIHPEPSGPDRSPMTTVNGDVAGLILAAGSGRRFAAEGGTGPKLLADMAGRPLVAHVIGGARSAGLDPIVVVLPPGSDEPSVELRRAVTAADPDVRIVVNTAAGTGIASSVAAGLEALGTLPRDEPPHSEPSAACVVLLADQPGIDLAAIDAVVAAWRRTGRPARARYDDGPGHPVALPRTVWSRIGEHLHPTTGDVGADEGARRMLGDLDVVDVVIPGPAPIDIDVPNDLPRATPAQRTTR
jgi:xanthine dehydrogenase accessory factor